MPELPEVELIKRQLNKFLVGHKIEKVEVRYKKCFAGNPEDIERGRVVGIRRFGKAQSIDLSNGYSIVVHIKLTGQLIYRGPNLSSRGGFLSPKILGGLGGKHTHVIFHLDKGGRLYYNDVRKFGWIKIANSLRLKAESEFIGKLGPEPVIDPKNPPEDLLTLEKFRRILGSSSRAVKVLLMDQTKVAGVGNIYANDALFLAGVRPEKRANELTGKQAKKLYESILEVLRKGLKYGGASELAYVRPDGTEGEYQDYTLVYGREGEVCMRCEKERVSKIRLGSRGTYFCSSCQK